jgi:hypothetical protein
LQIGGTEIDYLISEVDRTGMHCRLVVMFDGTRNEP